MPDEIIQELWTVKDSIAREHGNDVRKLAVYLERRKGSAQPSESSKRSADGTLDESPDQQLVSAGDGK